MVFDPDVFTEFRYLAAHIDRASARVDFDFELAGPSRTEVFRETVTFTPVRADRDVDWLRVEGLVAILGAVIGLSYYKAAAPQRYVISQGGITAAGVSYLTTVLSKGLAEFAFRNDLPGLLEPEIVLTGGVSPEFPAESHVTPDGDPLVPIGGGKDSVVTVELLAAARMHPVQFAVNPNQVIFRVGRVKGHPVIPATRAIDERLLELNSEGALNGHVPVTAINSLISLVQARIIGLGPVVMSLEASASEATLVWDGVEVNHQWSKSEEAEGLLHDMLGPQAGLSAGAYFSLLRPYSELKIARYFSGLREYHPVITSCNRAFRRGVDDARWCANCDKCRFIFLILSPFLPASALIRMFAANLLDDSRQIEGYRSLLGLAEHRPFECVGEQAESMVALTWITHQEDWKKSVVVTALVSEIPELLTPHPELEAQVLGHRDGICGMPGGYEHLGAILA